MDSSGTSKKRTAGGTRRQLLEAASLVFAEKSYRDATVAEICRQAGANIALVNYHFGDKETLYAEAWRMAFSRALEAHPADGGVPAGAPPEERLHGRILALLRRISSADNREFAIIQREIATPTGLLGVVMHEAIQPLHEAFRAVLRELLGPGVAEQDVDLCLLSIISQCLHPARRLRLPPQGQEGKRLFPALSNLEIETIADHITRFSLAGLREIRAARRGRGKKTGRI